ncbi:MAG: DivIVA domain-containing protein, partial [Actinomycetota bacterium]|nr:DivIVA domain-containing protein [Actinomycetota bacterium]
MPLSPQEIENKRFLVALRGYDKEEVDAFLRAVAESHAEALHALEQARNGQVPAAADDPFDDLRDDVAEMARVAGEAIREVRTAADRRAEEARAVAEADAARVRAEAAEELEAAKGLRADMEERARDSRAESESEAAAIL